MCKFNPKNGARRIDPCIKNLIRELKKLGVTPVGSCCGHFKYHLTIIVERKDKTRYDIVSGIEIPRKKKSTEKLMLLEMI